MADDTTYLPPTSEPGIEQQVVPVGAAGGRASLELTPPHIGSWQGTQDLVLTGLAFLPRAAQAYATALLGPAFMVRLTGRAAQCLVEDAC